MKLNLTNFGSERSLVWPEVLDWLELRIGKISHRSDSTLNADGWRMFKEEHSVEGFYEYTYWIEFDEDSSGTTFLLKWA